jgi:hypothetical protein
MTKDFGPSTFFVSDKSIFDGLMQKKIPKTKLLEFLQKRGIFFSDKATREEIAIYVSRTFVDYYVCQQISSFLESEQRKEKTTSSFVETEVEKSDIISACQSLKEDIYKAGETCEVSHQGDTTKITITYEEVDFSKTELRQRSTKTCEIEINSTEEGFSVRQPANDKANLFAEKIINNISLEKGVDLDPQVISLKQFKNPESRSFFFERLIQSIDGHKLDDVIAVNINHKLPESFLEDEDSEVESDPLTDYNLDKMLTGYITKAVLNGTGVLESSEFSQLHKGGFFISRIVWISIDRNLTNNKKVEFEALFKESNDCSDFAYSCKGYFERRGDDGFNITRKSFERSEEKLMTDLIEKAAKAAYQEVLNKYDGL